MWDGPYGIGGSRKYLVSSLDQSLKRLGLDYVDIFYHHCMTPDTELKETALALSDITRQGKAIYVGMSNYNGKKMHRMYHRCDDLNVPFIINQNRYSIFDRTVEKNDLKKDGTLFHDHNCAHLLSSSHVLLEAYRYYKPNQCFCQSFILIFHKKNLPFFTKNTFFVYFMRLTP